MKKQALLEQLVEKQRKEKRNEIEEYKNEIVERILSPLLTGFGRYENDAVSNPIKPIEWNFLDRNGT